MGDRMIEKAEPGFQFEGQFYEFSFTDHAKDLWLIDQITLMAPEEFAEAIQDDRQRSRFTIMQALIATSLRAGNPDWSHQFILNKVMNIGSFGEDVQVIDVEAGEQDNPPAVGGEQPPSSVSSDGESLPSLTPEDNSTSVTLSAVQS